MYLRLCNTNDVPAGCMKKFYLRDQEFLVVNLNGQFYCLDGRCSHAGAPLAEGDLGRGISYLPLALFTDSKLQMAR